MFDLQYHLLTFINQAIMQTQLVTIPFTVDGKYRPDLQRAPQLMPPPPSRDRNVVVADPHIQVHEEYRHMSAGSSSAAQLALSTAVSNSSSSSHANWSTAASGTGSMNTQTFDEASPPQNQNLRPLPSVMPVRRAPSVPMSVSSQHSDLMSPPPQYQRNPFS